MIEIDQQIQQLLFATAYKMTGEISASQDISQEAISKYLHASANSTSIKNHRSYLIKITINTAIDHLNRCQKERTAYIGTWLPEPILRTETNIDYQLDLDYGITVLLSQLTPKERAIFILKESFVYTYVELSDTLGLSNSNCRKIYQRLQQKINPSNRDIATKNKTKERIIRAFMEASKTGQLDILVGVLKEDIALYSDGGGKVTAATNSLHGIEICSKFLWGIYSKFEQKPRFVLQYMNNELGFLTYLGEELISVGLIEVEGEQISRIYFIRNPDKIHLETI
jgi:RNA polymerase sigma-70 factor (ECF subfamily)